jgi:TonB family protein
MKSFRIILALSVLFFLFMTLSINAQTKKTKPKTTTKKPIQVKSISAGIVNGKAIFLPKPVYPADLAKARISGTVNVQVTIDESGKVISAKAASGIDNLILRNNAEIAALQAKFSPTLLSGKPVKVTGVIVYNFVDNKGYEEETKFLAIGLFLNFFRNFAFDLDMAKELFEIKDFKTEFNPNSDESLLKNFSKDLEQFSNFENLSPSERIDLINKIAESIQSKATDSEKWQLELGGIFGDLFFSLAKVFKEEDSDFSKIDEPTIKLQLSKISSLLYSAPENFPAKVLQKFKEVSANSEKLDKNKPFTYFEFMENITNLFETISPE